jgi:hypothetical protein
MSQSSTLYVGLDVHKARRRQAELPNAVTDIAWAAQVRLCARLRQHVKCRYPIHAYQHDQPSQQQPAASRSPFGFSRLFIIRVRAEQGSRC